MCGLVHFMGFYFSLHVATGFFFFSIDHVFLTSCIVLFLAPSQLWPLPGPKGLSSSFSLCINIFTSIPSILNFLFHFIIHIPWRGNLIALTHPVMFCHSAELTDQPLCMLQGQGHLAKKVRHLDHTLDQAISRIVPLKSDLLKQVSHK